ncbi:peptidase S10, serine carboxypeptidase, alpha/beta hydrolase fold protein [Tanacetum coccineum]
MSPGNVSPSSFSVRLIPGDMSPGKSIPATSRPGIDEFVAGDSDTPAGVGFSYAKTWEASRSSDTILASNVYDFLRKGYIMISPLTDKFADFNSRLELAHRLSLISDDIYKSAIASCHGNYLYADDNNALYSNNLQQMEQCIGDISLSNTLEPFCALVNPDPTCPEATQIFSEVWANNKDVQKALNIREVKS